MTLGATVIKKEHSDDERFKTEKLKESFSIDVEVIKSIQD